MSSQIITMPLQLLQNATQQSDHHTQQCQLQKISQSHQAIAHQHMSTKCQKQQPDVDRIWQPRVTRSRMQPRAVSHSSGSNGMARLSQSRSDYHSYRSIRPFIRIHPRCRKSNENPIRAYQKTEVLNQNPMKIPPKPIRKQRFSIRIQ